METLQSESNEAPKISIEQIFLQLCRECDILDGLDSDMEFNTMLRQLIYKLFPAAANNETSDPIVDEIIESVGKTQEIVARAFSKYGLPQIFTTSECERLNEDAAEEMVEKI